MVDVTSLWLPIVLSAAAVFVLSSVIHMLTPWHDSDYRRLPNEDAVAGALRPLSIPPGDYMTPRPVSSKDLASPEFLERRSLGPVIVMTVLPNGPVSMGKSLGLWFAYSVVIGIFAAYVTGRVLPAGAEYLAVFRLVGTTAFASYTLGLWQMTIWYQRSAATTLRSSIDGLAYALVTAGIFGWLWP